MPTFLEGSLSEHRLTLSVVARNNSDGPVRGRLTLEAPGDWHVAPQQTDVTLREPDETATAVFTVTSTHNTTGGTPFLELHTGS